MILSFTEMSILILIISIYYVYMNDSYNIHVHKMVPKFILLLNKLFIHTVTFVRFNPSLLNRSNIVYGSSTVLA